MVAHILHERIQHCFALVRLNQIHDERNCGGALRTGGILLLLCVEKLPVERFADSRGQLGVMFFITGLAK